MIKEIGDNEVLIQVTPCDYPDTRWKVSFIKSPNSIIPDTYFWEYDDFWEYDSPKSRSKTARSKKRAEKLIKKCIKRLTSEIEDWNSQPEREGWTETITFEVKNIGK